MSNGQVRWPQALWCQDCREVVVHQPCGEFGPNVKMASYKCAAGHERLAKCRIEDDDTGIAPSWGFWAPDIYAIPKEVL